LHVELTSRDGTDALRVTGLPTGVAAALAGGDPAQLARRVIVATDEVVDRARAGHGILGLDGSLPAVAGRFVADGDALCFVPRFAFLPRTACRVLVHRSVSGDDATSFELDDYAELAFTVPALPGQPSTHVVEIHPTSTTIPRNQLKLYVTFSTPMSEGEVARNVSIRRAGSGEPIDAAFLPMDPELWDRSRRRVTVLFDPARIKRGLVPHATIGYPLVEGDAVDVVVDADFRDGEGRPLVAEARRRYTVGPDVRCRVDPAAWRLTPPAPGTHAPLVVTFDRPLDHALLQHCLTVVDRDARPVPGRGEVVQGEAAWSFTPDSAWEPGPYELTVDPLLEDLAGNSITRVFDRELARADHDPEVADRFTRAFVIRRPDG
jgi:hypothetical protein